MLARYQVADKEQLVRRIRLFQDADLQFAVFIAPCHCSVCLIPAFGPAFTELLQWPEASLVGTYNKDARQIDIVDDTTEEAYWIREHNRGDRVHYHRYRNKVVARNYLRRST